MFNLRPGQCSQPLPGRCLQLECGEPGLHGWRVRQGKGSFKSDLSMQPPRYLDFKWVHRKGLTWSLDSNEDTKMKRRSGANTCMVLSCLSPRQPGIIYHGFPKSHFPELQKQWLVACGRSANTVILRHMRICRYNTSYDRRKAQF